MKNSFLTLLGLVSLALLACAPSSLQIKEMSSECDFVVEVRYVENDSIGIFVGNTLFLNTRQVVGGSLFPMLISTRDPMNIDMPTATNVVRDPQELTAYLQKQVPSLTRFGIVIGDNVDREIGFEEAEAIKMLSEYFKTFEGGSLVLFHEKGGDLIDAEKLY